MENLIITFIACAITILLLSFLQQGTGKRRDKCTDDGKPKENAKKVSREVRDGQESTEKEVFKESLEESPFINFRKGEAARKAKNYDDAIRFYSKSIDIHIGHPTSYFYRAKCLQRKKLFRGAIHDFSKARDLLHDSYQCSISLAICYFHAGGFSKAIENCEIAITKNPRKAEPFYWMGLSYLKVEDYSKASFALIRARELGCEKSNAHLQIALGKYCEKNKNLCSEKPEELVVKKCHETVPKPKSKDKKEEPFLFINYTSTLKNRVQFYPVLKIPKKGTIVRSHRYGKTMRRGFKEEFLQKKLERRFSDYFEVSGNVRLIARGGESYEPDIALISRTAINIRIDIEIDEPYSGIDRKPTHFIGTDEQRDNFFLDRGWIVLRFSELQVHKYTSECLKYIEKVIDSVDKNIVQMSPISNNLFEEPIWSYNRCEIWEEENYREKYLNHQFNVVPEILYKQATDLTEKEIAEETYVVNNPPGKRDRVFMETEAKHENKKGSKQYNTAEDKINAITRAIRASQDIQFSYQKSSYYDNGKRGIRTIKPKVFEDYLSSICIKGYCYERKAERVFNIDRISRLEIDPSKITYWEEDNYDDI